jgi:hypothetical protein
MYFGADGVGDEMEWSWSCGTGCPLTPGLPKIFQKLLSGLPYLFFFFFFSFSKKLSRISRIWDKITA